MLPVSSMSTGAAQPLSPAGNAGGAPEARPAEERAQRRSPKPATDEYVPEEKREPSGRYWPGRDEDGRPRIYFDGPDQSEGPEAPDKKEPGKKAERCVADTTKVDREIERLKKKRAELEQRLSAETDERRIKELEAELAQVESELGQKDNDTYRRQHTEFS